MAQKAVLGLTMELRLTPASALSVGIPDVSHHTQLSVTNDHWPSLEVHINYATPISLRCLLTLGLLTSGTDSHGSDCGSHILLELQC